jgi:hypothetical protein
MKGVRRAWFTDDEEDLIDTGFNVARDKIFLRRVSPEDLALLITKDFTGNYQPKIGSFFLEWRTEVGNALDDDFPLPSQVLTAFMLYRMEQCSVGYHQIFKGEPSLRNLRDEYPSLNFPFRILEEYRIPINEVQGLIDYTQKFVEIDFKQAGKLRRGLRIMDRMVEQPTDYDALFVTLFQGFETMFRLGHPPSRGYALGRRVANKMHMHPEESEKCIESMKNGYSVRNMIAHGEEVNSEEKKSLFKVLFVLYYRILKDTVLKTQICQHISK